MIHLSDPQLQGLIEHGSTDPDPELATHLESCDQCRKHLEQIRMLFEKLETEEVEVNLSPDFAQKMAVRFKAEHIKLRRREVALKSMAAAVGAIALFIGYKILGVGYVGQLFGHYGLLGGFSTPEWATSLVAGLQSYEGSYNFVFMAAGVIILFGSMDKIIVSLKGNKISCL